MDWATIEQELETQTEARWRHSSSGPPLKSSSTTLSGNNMSLGVREGNILSPSGALLPSSLSTKRELALTVVGGEDEIKMVENNTMGIEYVVTELSKLRQICTEQAQRITTYEKLLMSQGSLSETIQSDFSNRICDLEKRLSSQSAISDANLYRNDDEHQFIKAKYDDMIYERLGKLEEVNQELRGKLGESVVSDIGKMLDTTLDHVSSLGTLTDKVKRRSDQAMLLLESLLQALTALSGPDCGDFEKSMLDFFAHATATDNNELRQKRVVNLLTDSLQKAVDRSIRDQMGPAIECLSDLFTPQLQVTESSLERKLTDIDLNVKSSHAAIFSRFEKNEIALSDVQRSVSNCESAMTLSFRDERSVKDKVKSLEESIRSLQILSQEQKELLSVVSTKHNSRQAHALSVAELEENVKKVRGHLEAHSKNHESLKNEIEDIKFDLQQAMEKDRLRDAENELALAGMKEETQGEYQSLRLSHKQIQGLIEQQVGELTRKFNKIETKFEKMRTSTLKINDSSQTNSPPSAVTVLPEQFLAVEEACKLLSEGQEGLRQSLANITFDFDDLKDRQKSQESAIASIKALTTATSGSPGANSSMQPPPPQLGATLTSTIESELVALRDKTESMDKAIVSLREGMDALQDEIVMLAPPDPEPPVSSLTSPPHKDPSLSRSHVDTKTVDKRYDDFKETSPVSAEPVKVPIGTKTEAPVTKEKMETVIAPVSLPSSEDLSSDSDFASSSSEDEDNDDEDNDDIIGVNPRSRKDESKRSDAAAAAPSPSPSDVLADQLRIRAELEREEALKRVAANKARQNSPPGKGSSNGSMNGPSVASLGADAASSQSIVSGSLLTGSGRRAGRSSGNGPLLSSASDANKPIFESFSNTQQPALPPPQLQSEALDIGSRKDTVQCTHCLRRLPKNAIMTHSKTCELRTELCPNGCGAKLLVLKMQKHLETCTHSA